MPTIHQRGLHTQQLDLAGKILLAEQMTQAFREGEDHFKRVYDEWDFTPRSKFDYMPSKEEGEY